MVSTAAIGNPIGCRYHALHGRERRYPARGERQLRRTSGDIRRSSTSAGVAEAFGAKRPIVSSAALAPEGIVYIGATPRSTLSGLSTGSGGFSGTVPGAYETRGLVVVLDQLDGETAVEAFALEALWTDRSRPSDNPTVIRRQFDAGGRHRRPALRTRDVCTLGRRWRSVRAGQRHGSPGVFLDPLPPSRPRPI